MARPREYVDVVSRSLCVDCACGCRVLAYCLTRFDNSHGMGGQHGEGRCFGVNMSGPLILQSVV